MKGRVFKRCTRCGARMPDGNRRPCERCGSKSYTWFYRAYVAKDENGRWIERWRGGFSRKEEAEHALAELMTSLHQGTFVPRNDLTLGEYLLEEWLPATTPPRVTQGTWNDRRRNLKHHVIDHIGTTRLQDLSPGHLNRLYAHLLADGRRDGEEGGLSPTSVRRIHAMLRKALNDAVRWALLERNPVVLADPPPAKAEKAAQRRRMRTWTAAQLRQFLRATEDDLHHVMWFLAVSTGLRRSEFLGLRWADVDLEAARLQVRQSVVEGDAEGAFELQTENKTSSSARTIHLDRRTVELLRTLKAEQDAIRAHLNEDHDLLFFQHTGRWWNPPAISLAFRRAVKAAGVPKVRLHDLRHTHATLLLRAGVNPKVVSERLGHSSVAFTLDTYAHVMPGMQPEAAEQFMDVVFNGDRPAHDKQSDPTEDDGDEQPDYDETDDDTSTDE